MVNAKCWKKIVVLSDVPAHAVRGFDGVKLTVQLKAGATFLATTVEIGEKVTVLHDALWNLTFVLPTGCILEINGRIGRHK